MDPPKVADFEIFRKSFTDLVVVEERGWIVRRGFGARLL